jgi:hypothetical protein
MADLGATALDILTRMARAQTENKRLRHLLANLVSEVDGDNWYARPPLFDRLECVFCESEWEIGTQESHEEGCPVEQVRLILQNE